MAALLSGLSLIGCNSGEPGEDGSPTASSASTSGAADGASTSTGSGTAANSSMAGQEGDAAADVTLELVDAESFPQAIAAHRGKVLLVDFWATWCGPCVKQFPHTVELYERFGPRGLAVISVSLNEPHEREAVLDFLRRQRATFDNYISRYGGNDESYDAFEISTGALPHLKLYDRQGQLVETFVSGDPDRVYKIEDIDRAVESLLAK